jgi:hypothetical protein
MNTQQRRKEAIDFPLHPDYQRVYVDWQRMADTSAGERTVKEAGEKYLPMPEGIRQSPNRRDERYTAYVERAVYFNYPGDTQTAMLGLMQGEPATFELPTALQPLEESATNTGNSLAQLLAAINKQQLLYSRFGCLLDIPETPAPTAAIVPKVISYKAPARLNWSETLNDENELRLDWVTLDESEFILNRAKMSWEWQDKIRLLALDAANDEYFTYTFTLKEWADFERAGDFDPQQPPTGRDGLVYPTIRGKRLNVIPFQIINATSLTADIEKPVLLPLADVSVAIYRGEADYRQALFMQGQETFWATGVDKKDSLVLGAGALLTTSNENAKFGFVGASGAGLSEMRESQANLHEKAINMGVALVENGAESGTALNIRTTIKTANMLTISEVGAAGLEQLLRIAAEWVGANPDDVQVTPNSDFSKAQVAANDVLQLWTAKLNGAPLSAKSYHEWLRRNDYTALSFEDEQAELQNEGVGVTPNFPDNEQPTEGEIRTLDVDGETKFFRWEVGENGEFSWREISAEDATTE